MFNLVILLTFAQGISSVSYESVSFDGDRIVSDAVHYHSAGKIVMIHTSGEVLYCPPNENWFCVDTGLAIPKGVPKYKKWTFGTERYGRTLFEILPVKIESTGMQYFQEKVNINGAEQIYFVKVSSPSGQDKVGYESSILEISTERGLLSYQFIIDEELLNLTRPYQLTGSFGLGSDEFERTIRKAATSNELLEGIQGIDKFNIE